MVLITDGSSSRTASVNANNELLVHAITNPFLQQESEENGNAYVWSSGAVDVDATDTILLVKNTSSGALHIDRVLIANGSVASRYDVHIPTTAVTTPTGTANTGINLNTASANTADAISKVDETTNSQGSILAQVYLAADSNVTIDLRGTFLGKNSSIAIDVLLDTSESAVSIYGHYIKNPA